MFDGLGSFDRQAAEGWLTHQIYFFDRRFLRSAESKCLVRRLDEFGLAPFFIKLDIQDYEYKALQGAEHTIRAHKPVLLIEAPPGPVSNFLKTFGYEKYAFRDGKFSRGTAGSLNTFYMTADKARLVEEYIKR